MAKSFQQWLWDTWELKESDLTEENVMKMYGINFEEARGTIDNFDDEYGDYCLAEIKKLKEKR